MGRAMDSEEWLAHLLSHPGLKPHRSRIHRVVVVDRVHETNIDAA